MSLDETFKHRELISKERHVRTMRGVEFFHLPIGSVISPEALDAAKFEHGIANVSRALRHEARDSNVRTGGKIKIPESQDRKGIGNLAFRSLLRRQTS